MKSRTLRIRHALFLSVFLFGIFGVSWGQAQDVFSRSDAGTGSWWHGNNPWYYATWNNNQNRPDVNTRHYVKIGHNNNTSMTTNGAFFTLASLDFQSGASSARTISADAVSSGLSFTIGIYNYSSGTHSFSTNIGVDASTVFFQNNHTGGMNFSGIVYLNSNTADFGGTGSGNFDVSATLSGSNGKLIKNGSNTLVLSGANTYSGFTTINSGILQLNKTGGGTLPSGNSITVNSGGTLRISSNQTLNNLTINAGGSVIVDANVQLTIDGSLSNSGTLTLENGATLVQTGSNANAGSGGTYNVKQVITGSSSGSAPNGRGWYMGSPVSGATSNLFAPTNSTNLIYHWNANQPTPNWAQLAAGSGTTLDVGKGYAVRVGELSSTITFSSSTLNNAPSASPITVPCYKQASSTYQGFNLVSNPFVSYLDWNDAWTGTNATNFESTIHYRVANGSDVMVFDTYNAQNGQGTTNSTGVSSATRYIPPMQGFWVKMASSVSASTNAVNLSLDNSMRDHYTSVVNGWTAGLKSSAQDFPMFLRLNIEQGAFKDQMLVFLKPQASSSYDTYDSEKMFLSGYPQLYTQVSNRKLVFNGLNSNKKITVIPVIVDIPTSGLYTFRAEEFNVEAGLILLEDKQEGITQDLTINDTYTFYANAGTISNRFFIRLHQLDPSISAQGPSNNWVESENEINEGGSVVVATNGRGKVTIQQDIDPLASDESDVTIRDAAGREVLSGKLSGLESVFQLDVPSGVYFVAVQLNGQVEVKKIFVQ
jgi:autotransporter-associated beta strand protein